MMYEIRPPEKLELKQRRLADDGVKLRTILRDFPIREICEGIRSSRYSNFEFSEFRGHHT